MVLDIVSVIVVSAVLNGSWISLELAKGVGVLSVIPCVQSVVDVHEYLPSSVGHRKHEDTWEHWRQLKEL